MKLFFTLLTLFLFSACEKSETTVQSSKELLIEKRSFSRVEEKIRDLEEYGDSLYALTNKKIYKIKKSDASLQEISLNTTEAEGFCLDNEGNIYIVDKQESRIIKLLKNRGYSIDKNFTINRVGSEKGALKEPLDILYSGYHSQAIFYVLDSGNKRIQIFNHLGAYLADFEAVGDNIVGSSNIFLCDNRSKTLKKVRYNFLTKKATQEVIFHLDAPTKVTLSSDGLLLTQNKKVLYLRVDGKVTKEIQTDQNNFMALSYNNRSDLFQVAQTKERTTKSVDKVSNLHLAQTLKEQRAIELSRDFVSAYLQDDTQRLKQIASQKLLEELKSKAPLLKELFKNVTHYQEKVYFNNQKALVTLTTKVEGKELNLQLYFIWHESGWQLKEIV